LTEAQVRRYYESGKGLQAARGHQDELRPPRQATLRLATGGRKEKDIKSIQKWRKGPTYPTWLPKSNEVMRDDTAAALALLGTAPRNWKDLVVSENPDGTFSVLVTTKRGAKRSTILADRNSKNELARLIRSPQGQGVSKSEQRRLNRDWTRGDGSPWSFRVILPDTDMISFTQKELDLQKLPQTPGAIPRKRK
jgi:hypothetical protein